MSAPDPSSSGAKLPRVTIVTPTYNQAQYLAETVDSVLAQDYPDVQYIVIDDGSTDDTREVLRSYDGRIQWESQENQGQAATLNKGWAMASGEIIGYLSSDDTLKANAVSESVRCLLDHPEAVLVYPDFELIDADSRVVRTFRTREFSYQELAVDLVCQPGPGALFWKKNFYAIGGWNSDLKQIPDFEYWLRLSQRGDFKRLPRVLASSRIHEASQSFRVVSIERAMEPVDCMTKLIRAGQIRLDSAKLSRWSIASAYLLSFRILFRSGLFRAGVVSLFNAVMLRPGLLARVSVWRVVGSALFGKTFYRALFRT